MLVYQAAERTVHDALASLLRLYVCGKERAAQPEEAADADGAPSRRSAKRPFEFSTGVPTLCKFVEYLLGVIKEAVDPTSKVEGAASAAATGQRASGGHRRSLSQQQHVPYQPPLNEVSFERSTLHLLFALKTISRLLSVAGNGAIIRELLVR